MTDGMGWVHSLNYREHKWEEDAMTETPQRPDEPSWMLNLGAEPMRSHSAAAIRRAYPLIRSAVIAEVVEELTNSGQLAAAGFVARLAENTQR